MKHLFIITFWIAATAVMGQTRIKSSEIIRQINEGRNVEYNNAEIEGELDLTNLDNRRLERGATSVFGFGGTEQYESNVEVSVKFTNCTFLGDVLAYYHIERRNETYIAHFEKDAVFNNCTFRKASEFKYSEFHGQAIFTGCTFQSEANFKYAEFSSAPSFTGANFNSGADFKYTEFPKGTTFERATFNGLANFKYSKFKTPLNMANVAFKGSEDFKYTKIDGRSFTSYLLEK